MRERGTRKIWNETKTRKEERKNTMRQATDNHRYSPAYTETISLYFTPSGGIVVRIGNQFIVATASDIRELIETRLAQHELFAQLYNRSDGEQQS
jgi:hypothetical protein